MDLKFHYCILNSLPLAPILGQINPAHIHLFYFFNVNHIIILYIFVLWVVSLFFKVSLPKPVCISFLL